MATSPSSSQMKKIGSALTVLKKRVLTPVQHRKIAREEATKAAKKIKIPAPESGASIQEIEAALDARKAQEPQNTITEERFRAIVEEEVKKNTPDTKAPSLQQIEEALDARMKMQPGLPTEAQMKFVVEDALKKNNPEIRVPGLFLIFAAIALLLLILFIPALAIYGRSWGDEIGTKSDSIRGEISKLGFALSNSVQAITAKIETASVNAQTRVDEKTSPIIAAQSQMDQKLEKYQRSIEAQMEAAKKELEEAKKASLALKAKEAEELRMEKEKAARLEIEAAKAKEEAAKAQAEAKALKDKKAEEDARAKEILAQLANAADEPPPVSPTTVTSATSPQKRIVERVAKGGKSRVYTKHEIDCGRYSLTPVPGIRATLIYHAGLVTRWDRKVDVTPNKPFDIRGADKIVFYSDTTDFEIIKQ